MVAKCRIRNYYPKSKKEIPKGNNHIFEAKEDSSSGKHGNNRNIPKHVQSFLMPLLLIGFVLISLFSTPQDCQQGEAVGSVLINWMVEVNISELKRYEKHLLAELIKEENQMMSN